MLGAVGCFPGGFSSGFRVSAVETVLEHFEFEDPLISWRQFFLCKVIIKFGEFGGRFVQSFGLVSTFFSDLLIAHFLLFKCH